MTREQIIDQINRRNEYSEESDPGKIEDNDQFLSAIEYLEQEFPQFMVDGELRTRLQEIDERQRNGGDRRPYLQRYLSAIEEIQGNRPDFDGLANALVGGDYEQSLRVVRQLMGQSASVAADPEPDDTQEVIGVMKQMRAPQRVVKADIDRMRSYFEE